MALIFTDIIAQNGYIGQYIRFVYYFSPMYNVSTWVVIRIYWKIYVPWASGPLDYIFQYIRITTHVLYQYQLTLLAKLFLEQLSSKGLPHHNCYEFPSDSTIQNMHLKFHDMPSLNTQSCIRGFWWYEISVFWPFCLPGQ